ncbi:MAG TPA: Rv3235 family protein [Microlunatus sp.]
MTVEVAIVAVRPVPASVPEPEAWPPNRPDSDEPRTAAQEPLPWSVASFDSGMVDSRMPSEIGPLTGRGPDTEPVRVLRFGDSWAPRLPPGLPDPGDWCVRLGAALLETVQGLRPVTQLNRWLDPIALADLTVHIRRRPAMRPVLHSVHVSRAEAEVVEAVTVFGWSPAHSARAGASSTAALAFRLEARGRRWMCTRLDTRPLAGSQQVINRRG